jgi:hypothetical protein
MNSSMVAPQYTSGRPDEKYKVSGSVLIFGAGALVHEKAFFDFDSSSTVVAYDPYYRNKVSAQDRVEQPPGLVSATTFCDDLSAALTGKSYDHVIALFSLHYEPQWISQLCDLTTALNPGGALYVAKDQGFRMILDGLSFEEDDLAREVRDVLRARHSRGGGGGDCGTPWQPSIRASDSRQLEEVLSILGFAEVKTTTATLTRQSTAATLRDEARQYLPWMDVKHDLLPPKPLPETLFEKVVVSKFTVQQQRLGATGFLSDSPTDRQIRSVVARDAASALATLDLALPQPSEEGSRQTTVKSLRSYGCAWLSVLYQHMLRHVPCIEAAQLIFQQPSGRHQHIVDDLIDVEFGSADDVIFLNCISSDPRLHPWNYDPTQRYNNYRQTLKSGGFEYLAKPIFSRGVTGVYWDGNTTTIVDTETGTDLTQEFSKRAVPAPCLYTPAKLAYINGLHEGDARPLTLVALIIYFLPEATLSASEWRALHASIYPLLDSATSRVALAEMIAGHHSTHLLAEKERAHQVLLRLQGPLDELTRAFESVQSEAQEMQAILNDPEEGLFKAHKSLAPLFHEGHTIQVSEFISVTASHDWDPSKPPGSLQAAYCYALACIFGIQKHIWNSSSLNALVERTRNAVKEKREAGVNRDLIQLLSRLCGWCHLKNIVGSIADIEDSVRLCYSSARVEESELAAAHRFSGALRTLKRVAFTPFKSFGKEWPNEPVGVAAITHRIMSQKEPMTVAIPPELPPQHTPFSQHAVLALIVGVKSHMRANYSGLEPINAFDPCVIDQQPGKGGILLEYRFGLPTYFFGRQPSDDLDAHLDTLQECLRSGIKYGMAGKVMGSFLGIFQDFFRHGINLATPEEYDKDSWVLLAPPPATWDRSILLVLGKALHTRPDDASQALGKFCDSDGKAIRYFAVVHEKVSDHDGYRLRIVWARNKQDVLSPETGHSSSPPTDATSSPPSPSQLSTGVTPGPTALIPEETEGAAHSPKWPTIVCIDHTGAWHVALSRIAFLTMRIKSHPYSDTGTFSPSEECVVVLHGNPPTERNSAISWKTSLEALHRGGRVLRVIVASAGGHPQDKGIEESDCFLWGAYNDEAINSSDLEDPKSAKRNHFLSLIQKGKRE